MKMGVCDKGTWETRGYERATQQKGGRDSNLVGWRSSNVLLKPSGRSAIELKPCECQFLSSATDNSCSERLISVFVRRCLALTQPVEHVPLNPSFSPQAYRRYGHVWLARVVSLGGIIDWGSDWSAFPTKFPELFDTIRGDLHQNSLLHDESNIFPQQCLPTTQARSLLTLSGKLPVRCPKLTRRNPRFTNLEMPGSELTVFSYCRPPECLLGEALKQRRYPSLS